MLSLPTCQDIVMGKTALLSLPRIFRLTNRNCSVLWGEKHVALGKKVEHTGGGDAEQQFGDFF